MLKTLLVKLLSYIGLQIKQDYASEATLLAANEVLHSTLANARSTSAWRGNVIGQVNYLAKSVLPKDGVDHRTVKTTELVAVLREIAERTECNKE